MAISLFDQSKNRGRMETVARNRPRNDMTTMRKGGDWTGRVNPPWTWENNYNNKHAFMLLLARLGIINDDKNQLFSPKRDKIIMNVDRHCRFILRTLRMAHNTIDSFVISLYFRLHSFRSHNGRCDESTRCETNRLCCGKLRTPLTNWIRIPQWIGRNWSKFGNFMQQIRWQSQCTGDLRWDLI